MKSNPLNLIPLIALHLSFSLVAVAQGPPPLTSVDWYYEDGNSNQQGPVKDAVITALIQTGAIRSTTRIWTNGFSGWMPAQSVPQFASHFQATPPPLPPPTGIFPPPGTAPLGGYMARISSQDKFTSSNTPLTTAAEILKQDRANYHRFGKRDPEDQGDSYFDTSEKRASAGFSMSSSTENAIVSGNPLVTVIYQNGAYQVSLSQNPGNPQPPNPGIPMSGESYTAKISNQDKFTSNNTRLSSATEILKQDRANYHKYNKRDFGDQNDTYLTTTERRSSARFTMSSSTAASIVNGTPTVLVNGQNGSYQVSILSN